MSRKHKAVLEFSDKESRDFFLMWFSESGEQGLWNWWETDHEDRLDVDYKKAFKAWGYSKKKHGDPTVIFKRMMQNNTVSPIEDDYIRKPID